MCVCHKGTRLPHHFFVGNARVRFAAFLCFRDHSFDVSFIRALHECDGAFDHLVRRAVTGLAQALDRSRPWSLSSTCMRES